MSSLTCHAMCRACHAVYPSGRYTQPKVRALIDFLVEKFGSRNSDGW